MQCNKMGKPLVVRALDHPILGPKFGPIPNAKKYVFFPIPGKNSQFDKKKKKKKKFFFFGSPSFFHHRITEYNSTCFFLSLFS